MEKELKIIGEKEIGGMKIKCIEGGFGAGQKCILFSDVAKEHGVESKKINELINRNIKRYTNDDLIDLCNENFKVPARDLGLITSNGQKYCYLLSERGYIKLVSSMANDNDKKWEVMDKIVNEYFRMREIINSDEELKAKLLLDIYNGGQSAVVASKRLSDLEKKPLLDKIEEDKPLVQFANTVSQSKDSITIAQFAKLIKDEKINLGRNKLFAWLRDNKYLRANNEPYQKYIDNNVFTTIEHTYDTPYGIKLINQTLITPHGQIYLTEKLRNIFK